MRRASELQLCSPVGARAAPTDSALGQMPRPRGGPVMPLTVCRRGAAHRSALRFTRAGRRAGEAAGPSVRSRIASVTGSAIEAVKRPVRRICSAARGRWPSARPAAGGLAGRIRGVRWRSPERPPAGAEREHRRVGDDDRVALQPRIGDDGPLNSRGGPAARGPSLPLREGGDDPAHGDGRCCHRGGGLRTVVSPHADQHRPPAPASATPAHGQAATDSSR